MKENFQVAMTIVVTTFLMFALINLNGCAITPGELDLKQELHVKP